jgi:hypothetical protein
MISKVDLMSLVNQIQNSMVKKVQEFEGKTKYKQTGKYEGFGKEERQLEQDGKFKW